ncbi:MAG: DUF2520 domain-containing protein [Myxococcota bacterium]|nr:DUF2520 domain-containing protein [Myxococcota bacterium]
MTKIVIVGPGRLGRSAHAILSRRNISCTMVGKNVPIPRGSIYYLTVPDKELYTACGAVPKEGLVIHASGTYDHTVLRPRYPAAVVHPLMTFPGPEIALPSGRIPASVCADKEVLLQAEEFAQAMNFSPFSFDASRKRYHCAAVVAGNFSTFLLQLAGQIMSKDSDLTPAECMNQLLPLAQQSLQNALLGDLNETLTGPIARGDSETVQNHQEGLSSLSPHFSHLYDEMTIAIRKHLKWEKEIE